MLLLDTIRYDTTVLSCTQTSVSETIRKPPLAEAQTALRKQNAGISPIAKILEKAASPRKISLKSGNRLLSYGQKQF